MFAESKTLCFGYTSAVTKVPPTLNYFQTPRHNALSWLKIAGAYYAGVAIGTIGVCFGFIAYTSDAEAAGYAPFFLMMDLGLLLVLTLLAWLLIWFLGRWFRRTPRHYSTMWAFLSSLVWGVGMPLIRHLPLLDSFFDMDGAIVLPYAYLCVTYIVLPSVFYLMLLTRREDAVLTD